jgi:phage gp45-like
MIRGTIELISWVAGRLRRFTGTGRIGEKFRSRELMQHYGFCSDPPAGAKNVVLKNGNLIISIAEDSPDDRPDLDALEGAAAIHSDADNYVMVMKNGDVIIKTSGAIKLGDVSGLKKLIHEDIITALAAHTHTLVTPGEGMSGPPAPGTFTTLLHATDAVEGK